MHRDNEEKEHSETFGDWLFTVVLLFLMGSLSIILTYHGIHYYAGL